MPFCGKFGLQFFRTSHFPQCEIQSIWKGLYESGKWEREVRKGGRNLSWFFVINRCSFTCVWGYTKNGDWKTSHMKGEQYCLGKSRTESGLSEKNGRDRACSTINDWRLLAKSRPEFFLPLSWLAEIGKRRTQLNNGQSVALKGHHRQRDLAPCHGLDKRSVTL